MDDERSQYDRDLDDLHLDDVPEMFDEDYVTIHRLTTQQGDGEEPVAVGQTSRLRSSDGHRHTARTPATTRR